MGLFNVLSTEGNISFRSVPFTIGDPINRTGRADGIHFDLGVLSKRSVHV